MIINNILFMFEDGKTIQFSPRYNSSQPSGSVRLSGWAVTVWGDAGPCYQVPLLEDFYSSLVAPDLSTAERFYELTEKDNEPQ
jgi:hypothetical protein